MGSPRPSPPFSNERQREAGVVILHGSGGRATPRGRNLAAAEHHLKPTLALMDREGFGFSRWRVVAALADVPFQNEELSQAREYHREAARLLEAIASAVPDDRLQDLVRQREDIARVLRSAA